MTALFLKACFAALITGYIYYLRAKREKRPLWVIVTTNVVGKVGQELGAELRYGLHPLRVGQEVA